VVVVAVLGMTASVAAADVQQQETNDTYAVVQGEDCTEISPLYGNESVKSFYDYRTPIPRTPRRTRPAGRTVRKGRYRSSGPTRVVSSSTRIAAAT